MFQSRQLLCDQQEKSDQVLWELNYQLNFTYHEKRSVFVS